MRSLTFLCRTDSYWIDGTEKKVDIITKASCKTDVEVYSETPSNDILPEKKQMEKRFMERLAGPATIISREAMSMSINKAWKRCLEKGLVTVDGSGDPDIESLFIKIRKANAGILISVED
jgi:hypothetical protein